MIPNEECRSGHAETSALAGQRTKPDQDPELSKIDRMDDVLALVMARRRRPRLTIV
jgi:hypothetical protein